MSMNLGTIFLPLTPNMCSNVDKNKILMTKNYKEWIIIFVDFIDV